MAIYNPYNKIEHKVYKRTFMRSATATIKYADRPFLSYKEALAKFFKDNFNVDYTPDEKTDPESININSNAEQLSFSFFKSVASVSVGAKDYKSFADSLQPRIGSLVAYLDAVNVENAENVTLRKENVWDLKSDDVMSAYKSAIYYTFKDENIREVVKLNVPEGPKPIKLSREANVSLGDGKLTVQFVANILDDGYIKLELNLEATATNVKTAEIFQTFSILNDVLYCAFHDMVSPDIINLMSKQK